MFRRKSKNRQAGHSSRFRRRIFERLHNREMMTTTLAILDFNGAGETDLKNVNARLTNRHQGRSYIRQLSQQLHEAHENVTRG